MVSIKVNGKIIAVSDTVFRAMSNLCRTMAEYLGVRNENMIELGEGIIYMPWSDSAKAEVVYNNEKFDIFITYIKEV